MLKRIIALLLSLADLAERAAVRSSPVRCLMLWGLRLADEVARDFVADCASDASVSHWLPALPDTPDGHDATDAMALALSLRMLAMMLQAIAAHRRHHSMLFAEAGNGREGESFRNAPSIEIPSPHRKGFQSGPDPPRSSCRIAFMTELGGQFTFFPQMDAAVDEFAWAEKSKLSPALTRSA